MNLFFKCENNKCMQVCSERVTSFVKLSGFTFSMTCLFFQATCFEMVSDYVCFSLVASIFIKITMPTKMVSIIVSLYLTGQL